MSEKDEVNNTGETDDDSGKIADASDKKTDQKKPTKSSKKRMIIVFIIILVLSVGAVCMYHSFREAQGENALRMNDTDTELAVMTDYDFLVLCGKGPIQQINGAIKNGANVNARGNKDITPLMFAVMNNPNPEVLSALIKAGADVNAKDKAGLTPLMFAAWYNSSPKTLITLVNAGADVNMKSNTGTTPFMFAVMNNSNPEVILTLLQLGVNSKERDNSGFMAMDYARERIALRNTDVFWTLNDACR